MRRPARDTLPAAHPADATRPDHPDHLVQPSTSDESGRSRAGRGPLGALPALSPAARRALVLSGLLALLNAGFLVAQAFLLASVLADIVGGHPANLAPRLGLLLGAVAGRALVAWGIRVVAARAAAGAKEELRAQVLDHSLRLGPEWVARRGPGELTALTTKGLDALDAYFTEYLPALVTAAVVPVAAGVAVLAADVTSALLIVITLPLLPMFGALIGSYTRDQVAKASDSVTRLSAHLLELVRALPVLAAFRRAEAQADTVHRVSDRHRRATLGTLRVAFSSAFALELAATLSVALVAVVIGIRLVHGELPLAIGLGVLLLAPECFQPLRAVGTAFHASTDGVEAVRRVTDVLDEPVTADGAAAPRPGDVRVRDLRVHRRSRDAPDGETFTARPGHTVWLRSPSGAGKSTTLAVLLGFLRPDSGEVTVGGTSLSDLDPVAWREHVAWVPQEPAFTGGSVRDELDLAARGLTTGGLTTGDLTAPDGAAFDHAELLRRLGLDGFADRGIATLSVGQRQRVALARALTRVRAGAWLLLLDEPTAHLDADNAQRAHALIDDAARDGCAVVIAAHDRTAITAVRDDPATAAPRSVPHDTAAHDTDVSNAVNADATNGEGAAAGRSGRIPFRRLVDRRFLGGVALGAGALLAGVALTATSGWLIARASQQPPILMLSIAVVGVRTFGLARAALSYAERLVTHDAAFRIAATLRVWLWRALVGAGPANALRHGESQRRLVGDVDTVRDLLPRVLTPPLVVAAVVAAACGAAALVLPAAGLALLVAAAVAALAAPLTALSVERRATAALASGRRDVEDRVLSLFDGAAELIAFGAHRRRRSELAELDSRLAATARRQALGTGAAEAVIIAATGGAAVASAWFAGSAVAAGTLAPVAAPVVALIPLALAEVLSLLPPVAQHWDTLRGARTRLAAADRAPVPEPESPGHEPVPEPADTGVADPAAAPGIELRGATFAWPSMGEAVLRDVDLHIPRGAQVAVVGPSGAGKSTLLAALLGFLRPVRGRARVPGSAAWAPQDPQLVSTTVAENLRLADPHATESRLARALRTAHVELGLDTMLDSAGAGLSGGQAQRVALARALLAAPEADVVLLDEPTAHLDRPTADRVLADLREALRGRTVVHVTHRPEEVAGADVVVEIAGGRVRTRAVAQDEAGTGGAAVPSEV